MVKIAVINGNWMKDAEEPVKGCYIGGELQARLEEFSKTYKIIDVKPISSSAYLVIYEN